METTVISRLAGLIYAWKSSVAENKMEWAENHKKAIIELVDNDLPFGSGIDNGTRIDLSRSTANKIYLSCDFHRMDENGFYDGWIEFSLVITPDFISGLSIRITGGTESEKDDLHGRFYWALKATSEDVAS